MSMSFATSSSLRTRAPGRGAASGLSRTSSAGGSSSPSDAGSAAPTLRRSTSTDLTYANLDSDEDFERLLASYDVPLVVDVLRRYLAMEVQSSLAGTAASKQNAAQIKRKFYERFNQILDRLFGNDDVSKHKYGGWLDYSVGFASAAASGALGAQRKKRFSSSNLGPLSPAQEEELQMESYVESLTAGGRALAEFLGFLKEDEAGSMFQLLFKMTHPVEFKLELDLLPEQSKMSLLSRSAYTSVLFTQLLSKPITKQRVDPRNPILLVSIKELFLFYFMRHPACANHQANPATSEAAAAAASSSLMGSITDTFARSKRKENYSWRAFFTEGVGSLTKGNPYNVLLLQYLKLFFPDSSKPVKSRFHGKLLQYSNLFLHILIEFWLRQNLIVFSDDASGMTSTPSNDWSGYRVQQKLASPLATVLTHTTYMAPSDDLLSSLLLTIIHLLSDSFYPVPLEASTSSTSASYSGMAVGSGGGYLSPSISVMRRPLYEMLRLVFSRAPIGLSPTAFFAISDVWLAYIQPWNCQHWSKGQAVGTATGAVPRRSTSDTTSPTDAANQGGSSTPAAYSSAWETYVLANYHFYTTLLGAFIERAKELDFTGGDERSLIVLDRVLNVFNPELLTLLRNASDFLDKNQPYSIASSSSLMQISSRSNKSKNASDRAEGLTPLQGQVLTYHCKALGIECIGVPMHATYHRDAERVFDKLWNDSGISENASPRGKATTPSWVGQTPETPFERIHRLSRQLRRVFEISDAYVASTTHSRSLSNSNGLEPLEPSRHSKLHHLLTLEGVNQLRRGLRLCSPEELSYIGDPMLRPICSYEIGLLVRLSYRISTWLNNQFGLHNPYKGKYFEDNAYVDPEASFKSFRFNLRFLASKPNLGFLTLLVWFLYLLLLW